MNQATERFFTLLPKLGRYRSVLCLNGSLPAVDFFKKIDYPIVATDGAYNRLMSIGIIPDVAIGDGDSIQGAVNSHCQWIYAEDQNFSDFEKALLYLEKKSLLPAIILGINGGFLDHILHNIEIFSQTSCIGFDGQQLVINLRGCQNFEFGPNIKISFFGTPECIVTTQGLRWELDHFQLKFPFKNSCFNRCLTGKFEITVNQGKGLMIVYLTDEIDAGSFSYLL